MKIPDKRYTKLWKSFQRNESSAAHCSAHIKIIQDDHKSTFYTPFPDFKLLFFAPSQAHFSNLTFSEFATFHCSYFARTLKRGGGSFSFFFSWLCSLNSLSLIKQRGKLNRELSRLVSEISRICLQQREMVITVDQGIRLRPYGFAKYTVRVNHFHLSTFSVSAKLSVFLSHPLQKSKFRKRAQLPLLLPFFVLSPLVRSNFFTFWSSF